MKSSSKSASKKRRATIQKTQTLEIKYVNPKDIVVPKGLRRLDANTVNELKESIAEIGLLYPLTVFYSDAKNKWVLVAGQHRLAALRELAVEPIPVAVVKRNTKRNEQRRITENLHRKELDGFERDRQHTEWALLKAADTKGKPNAQPHDKGISKLARLTGKSAKAVRSMIKADAITEDAKAVLKAAGLDTIQSVKLEVAKLDPEDQVEHAKKIVARRKAGAEKPKKAAKSAQAAKVRNPDAVTRPDKVDHGGWDDDPQPYSDLLNGWELADDLRVAWEAATAEDQRKFVREVMFSGESVEL
ncbi:MAG TPA: ParB/RepB/Spo0J family partition protein [Pseudolabrys sp.]|uniref:ParB/RepB/Spo0J family partition protein n=1 Tax=Pseudolabrys sp. TaxID=1960880 RepID=UPI002DDCE8D1|nr:ParB/RepB/Spo0J family partition protein [Pseudolabrys sp.]HEV2631495.1 ParB/RepB/Spo0J family partition protein [Pseudolabrys sp.]